MSDLGIRSELNDQIVLIARAKIMISHFWNFCRACPALEADKVMQRYLKKKSFMWKIREIGACQTHLQGFHEIIVR